MRWILIVLAVITLAYAACRHAAPPTSPIEHKDEDSQVFVGLASYYGGEFAGKTTASGQPFDPNRMTAAHRTLPFGTLVRVTNLDNNRSVVVTITDRGPERADRIIDVSLNAARELMMMPAGVVKVRLEVLKNEEQ
ncbi:MAG TPA: septal ring lytic transglycosylase RlpA family protein [Acidobacteriota bacterium]|nr:septal ring lytic transglycosylase RlpA family protein [Acidobacteriota bacterium]